MENNNLNSPTQPSVPTPAPSSSSNKTMLWLLGGIIATVILIGAIYLWQNQLSTVPKQALDTVPQTNTFQTAVPTPQENLENELNNLDVNSGADADFTSIDQDLKQL